MNDVNENPKKKPNKQLSCLAGKLKKIRPA